MKAIKLYKSTFQIFGKRPQIIINNSGIWDRSSQRKIHWNTIEDAQLIVINGQKHLSLHVKGEDGLVKQSNISLARIRVNEDQLARFIHDMMTASSEERIAKIKGVTEPGTEV